MTKSIVAITKTALNKEAKEATYMLKGKVVSRVWRHRAKEIGLRLLMVQRFLSMRRMKAWNCQLPKSKIDNKSFQM
jgi:hypothetical protein